MHRSKLAATAIAVMMAVSAALVLVAGGAAAAEWHTYEGDIHPGHAYGLQVPADSTAVEVAFEGMGAAELAVFDPAGELVAFYELSQSPSKATVVSPVEGRYVLYVYEVVDGALSVRVNTEAAPALSLEKIPLAREDVVLTQVDEPAALDEVLTTKLELTPVFVTLLYEGSAQDLDATVSSTRGAVATIVDETATAFSPGVWSSQTGTRTSDAANLASGAYTVALQAASFQGTLVLTSLALDLVAEAPVDEAAPVVVPPVQESDPALFALPLREPVAAQLAAGTLVIADAEYLQDEADKAAADKGREKEDDRHRHGHYYGTSRVLVYTPADELLAVVVLDSEKPVASLEIPEEGEYVLYTSLARHDLLAKLEGMAGAPETRVLELAETRHKFEASTFLGSTYEEEFQLEHVPVSMRFRAVDGVGALEEVAIENEEGVVLSNYALTQTGPLMLGGYHVDDSLFAAGEHRFHVEGLLGESVYELRVLHYVRETAPEPVAEAAAEAPQDEESPDDASDREGDEEPEDERTLVDDILDLLF